MPDGEDAHDCSHHFFAPLPWPPWHTASRRRLLPPPRAGFSFPQKQTLTYSVDWRVFSAGTAVLHFEAAGDRERITANADTSRRHQPALPRQRPLPVHLRPQDRLHLRVRQADRRGPAPDQLHAQARLRPGQIHPRREELVTGQTKHVETAIPGCLTDLLSGVFYASSQPMEVGKSFVIPVVDALHTVPGDHEGGRHAKRSRPRWAPSRPCACSPPPMPAWSRIAATSGSGTPTTSATCRCRCAPASSGAPSPSG